MPRDLRFSLISRRPPDDASRQRPSNACGDRQTRNSILRRRRSRSVVCLRRRLTRLRGLKKPSQVGVAHLRQRALAGSDPDRRVARDAYLAFPGTLRDEEHAEFVAIVLADASRGKHAPGLAADVYGTSWHEISSRPLQRRDAPRRRPRWAPRGVHETAFWDPGLQRTRRTRRAAIAPRTASNDSRLRRSATSPRVRAREIPHGRPTARRGVGSRARATCQRSSGYVSSPFLIVARNLSASEPSTMR